MDIEFIELQHRDSVLQLIQICNITMQQAYELYHSSNNHFQTAIHAHFYKNESPKRPYRELSHQKYESSRYSEGDGENGEPEYEKYKKFVYNCIPFSQKYSIKNDKNNKQTSNKLRDSEDSNNFQQWLQEFIGKQVSIKLEGGNLSECLVKIHREKIPLAVFILDFDQNSKQYLTAFFSEHLYIQKNMNLFFKNYGINSQTYEFQTVLALHFNIQKEKNRIVILRIDLFDQIKVMSSIKLSQNFNDIKNQIKQAKAQCIQRDLEEMHIEKQFSLQGKGKGHYTRPKGIKQMKKIKEDQKIREQQEVDFFNAGLNIPKCQLSNSTVKRKVQEKEKIIERRTQLRNNLKLYDQGIQFKIRVLSGKHILLTVNPAQKVKYLFDFIESREQDIGFVSEQRKFDIVKGLGGSETFRGKQSSLLSDYFKDSQVLIVKQLVN